MAKKSSGIQIRDGSRTESCGYVTFIMSTIFFFIYFLWALLPDHIIEITIDENYYPPRDLAAYIPAYLVLLFVFVPILYTGLNMLSCPAEDSIDCIWDTKSNCDASKEASTRYNPSHYEGVKYVVPTICDEDVRSVNLRLRQKIITKRQDDDQKNN